MTKGHVAFDNARSLDARRRFAGCLWSVGIAVLASLDMTLDKTRPEDFDTVLIPEARSMPISCGWRNRPRNLWAALTRPGNHLAVICHGPWLLIASRAAP